MKKLIIVAAMIMSMAQAQDAETLAKQKACLGCHSIHHQGISVPPAYDRIAERYRDRPDALDYISERIQYGGQNVWGGHMPAFSTLTPAEIKTLATWILSIK